MIPQIKKTKPTISQNGSACEIDGEKFVSLTSAGQQLGVTGTTIKNRCLSDKYPNYCLLKKNELQV